MRYVVNYTRQRETNKQDIRVSIGDNGQVGNWVIVTKINLSPDENISIACMSIDYFVVHVLELMIEFWGSFCP